MSDRISLRQFRGSEGVEDWRVLSDGAYAFFRAGSFVDAVRLVDAIARLQGLEEHHPAVDIRHDGVTIRLITVADGYYGLSRGDVDLAQRISVLARGLGLAADPSVLQSLLVIPGAPAGAGILPFWRAVLGYSSRSDTPDEDIVDPRGLGPSVWFEQMNEPRGDGGGAIHLAVFVPYEEAEARVAAALAAGGRIVRDSRAPMWWTLADPAGNEADVATTEGRD